MSNPQPAEVVGLERTKTLEKKKSRHAAPESDPSVKYLTMLEEKYKDNPTELAKVMAIKVHPEYIEIAGLKMKRKNESAATNEAERIYNYN